MFSSPDSTRQNGCAESLVKSVKCALELAVGHQIFSFVELQTVCFEATNLVNERPIGRHPTIPEDGTYLSPNHLLLGRATIRAPRLDRFLNLVSHIAGWNLYNQWIDAFWRRWTPDYFPCLIIRQKWHVQRRNVKVCDIVVLQDPKMNRGCWKLARMLNIFPSQDGKVRRVELEYKNEKNEDGKKYSRVKYTKVERSVQKIIVLVPVNEEDVDDETSVMKAT